MKLHFSPKTIKLSIVLTLLVGTFGYSPSGRAQAANTHEFAQYVKPLIGSGGHGHVFVGASVPFGNIQLGPTNIYKGWDWCSGYHYSDSIIIGFSHNHLSGTGCSDLGDVGLMPFTGKLRAVKGNQNNLEGAVSAYFHHKNEITAPGYYAVTLDNGIKAELTSTERVGFHHYIYNKGGERRLLIDLVNDVDSRVFESYIHKIDEYTVEGYRFVRGWSPLHKTFFYAKFNRPIKSLNTFYDEQLAGTDELQSKKVKGVVTFGDDVNDVLVKVALSSVSCTNAKMNMESELPNWDFNATKAMATQKWNKELSVISIDGTLQEKEIFYTALYHTMMFPCLYCDVNGDFRGMDDKVYTGNSWKNYTIFSTWDTYRALHPLFTIIQPNKVSDMVNSCLSIFDQQGKLPIWPLYAGETNCMPGYSSVPIIADAYNKGIKGFDAERALKDMVATATNPKQKGISLLLKFGYIPADSLKEATSVSQEYAVDDWGLALMAKKMGHMNIYDTFMKRGHVYEQYWDKKINKIHPKMANGSWYEPYDLFTCEHHGGIGDFTEGNGWQYTFMMPQDPDGLIALNGGDKPFVKNLDSLFVAKGSLGPETPPDVDGLIGMYGHGNEPSHHVSYLYAFAGQQWKTAQWVRFLQKKFYTDDKSGYCGNEDCGQMSAWHVLSAMGIYQVTPSKGIFVFGSPSFKTTSIKVGPNKTFTILAKNNNDKNIYIQSAKLNGKSYTKSYITYEDIMKGGTLEFIMGNKPNKHFGANKDCRPTSNEKDT